MNILTIDTATNIEIVSIAKNTQVAENTQEVGVSHSQTLFATIDTALKELEITIREIDLIAVGIGPGSFTGIRIAVTTARMLAQLLSVPLLGIPTQLLYAVALPAKSGDYLLVAFDAKKKRVFGSLYQATDNPLEPEEIIPPGDYYLEDMIAHMNKSGNVVATGSGIHTYKTALHELSSHTYLEDFIPRGTALTSLARRLYTTHPEHCYDYTHIKPFYSRKSDAEIMKEMKKK